MGRLDGRSTLVTAAASGIGRATSLLFAREGAAILGFDRPGEVEDTAKVRYGTGVRVNAICPGLIETGMTRPIYTAARERGTDDKIGQLNPLRRGGQPHEIAGAALFLASDDSSYVNGQAIVVDGGLSSSHPVGSRGG